MDAKPAVIRTHKSQKRERFINRTIKGPEMSRGSDNSSNSEKDTNEIYTPLDPSNQEIRIVGLYPSYQTESPIYCRIRKVSPNDCPTFDALSWAWGDVSNRKPIFLNNKRWLAPETLVKSLYDLRDLRRERSLWVDALCINPSRHPEALAERIQQVRLMQWIYRNAANVIIWMDLKSFDMDRLNSHIDYLNISTSDKVTRMQDAKRLLSSLLDGSGILHKTWWDRLWVLQEAVLTQQAYLCAGPTSQGHRLLPFNHVLQTLKAFSDLAQQFDGAFQRANVIGRKINIIESLRSFEGDSWIYWHYLVSRRAKDQQERDEWSAVVYRNFVKILLECRFYLTSDPRDKINGLLGFVPAEFAAEMSSNYDEPIARSYSRTTSKLLRSSKSLYLLSQVRPSIKTDISATLPSWVPDWTIRQETWDQYDHIPAREHRESLFDSCQGRWPFAELQAKATGSIKIEGIKVDKIARCGDVMPSIRSPQKGSLSMQVSALQMSTFISWELLAAQPHRNSGLFKKWSTTSSTSAWSFPSNSSVERSDLDAGEAYIGGGGGRLRAFWRTMLHDMEPLQEAQAGKPKIFQEHHLLSCASERQRTVSNPLSRIMPIIQGQRFFLTKDGFMGLGPPELDTGDMLFVLAGGTHPFVLRQVTLKVNHFKLVGECFAAGIMDGEVVTQSFGAWRRRKQILSAPMRKKADDSDGIWEELVLT